MSPNTGPTQAIQANPLFGRPIWSYLDVNRFPVRGPQPRLATGSNKYRQDAHPGTHATLPAYVADNEYYPSVFTYDPIENPVRQKAIPATLPLPGTDDGLHALNPTQRAHEFSMGDRFNHQMRSTWNWQVMEFPVNFRNLLAFQMVRKYRVNNLIQQARPLARSNYFLGYQVNPETIDGYSQSTIGNMGG